MSLVPQPNAIRLAMLGSTPGNGHPYSWSAMFNGYDREAMTKECPFAGIPAYLNKQPAEGFTIPGAKVTHIHCEGGGGFTAEHVAKCALIPHVVAQATDVIGQVDAVVLATDIGREHVARARPFIEAGLPVFIDKPLTDNAPDLQSTASTEATKSLSAIGSSTCPNVEVSPARRLIQPSIRSLSPPAITAGSLQSGGTHGNARASANRPSVSPLTATAAGLTLIAGIPFEGR